VTAGHKHLWTSLKKCKIHYCYKDFSGRKLLKGP